MFPLWGLHAYALLHTLHSYSVASTSPINLKEKKCAHFDPARFLGPVTIPAQSVHAIIFKAGKFTWELWAT